jgi:hypothetical protein
VVADRVITTPTARGRFTPLGEDRLAGTMKYTF